MLSTLFVLALSAGAEPAVPATASPAVAVAYRQSLIPEGAPTAPREGDRVEASVRAAIAKARGGATVDPRLALACEDYLAETRFDAADADTMGFELFRYLLLSEGIVDTEFLPWHGRFESVARASSQASSIVSSLVSVPFNRYGVASHVDAKGRVSVAVVVTQREVGLEPIAREESPNASINLRLSAAKPVRLYLQDALGAAAEVPVETGADAQRAVLTLGAAPGRYVVEMVFSEKAGPRIVASFPLFVGSTFPERFVPTSFPPEVEKISEAESETRLVRLLNGTRTRYGLPVLTADPSLSGVARQHSAEMKKAGFGRSVAGTSLPARLDAAGGHLFYRDAAELIGAGSSAAAIHASLLASPAHRIALLDAHLTHLGAGLVTAGSTRATKTLYGTLVLTQIIPRVEPARAAEQILAGINARRVTAGAAPLSADPALAGVAVRHAEAMFAAQKPDYEVDVRGKHASLVANAKTAAAGAKALGAWVGVLADPGDEIDFSGVSDPAMQRAGIGLVQGDSPEFGRGSIWLVVLTAR